MEVVLVQVLVVFVERQLGLVVRHIHHRKLDQLLVSHIHLQLVLLVRHSCLQRQQGLHSCLVVPQLFGLMLVELLRYRDNHQVLAQ